MEDPLNGRLAVVLVRPAGAGNIGSVARAMKNTGFHELVLVNPMDFRNEEAYRMAVHSGEILDRARVTGHLEEALADRHVVFGVTARSRHKRPRLPPLEAAEMIMGLLGRGHDVALVFGPEDFDAFTKTDPEAAIVVVRNIAHTLAQRLRDKDEDALIMHGGMTRS